MNRFVALSPFLIVRLHARRRAKQAGLEHISAAIWAVPWLPANTFPGTPSPNDSTAFANTTLETFEQGSVFTGCMACHNSTMKPTDFVWSLNDHAHPASSATPTILMQNAAFRGLRDTLMRSKQENLRNAAAQKKQP